MNLDLDWEVPIEKCKSFQQKFYRACLELKANLGIENLGKLYDHEPIELDLKGNVKLILFVDCEQDPSAPSIVEGKFLWRSSELFEHLNFSCFIPDLYEQYKLELLNFFEQNPQYTSGYEPVKNG